MNEETLLFIVFSALFGIYSLCTLIAVVKLVFLFVSRQWEWDIKKGINLMIPFGLLLRDVWFALILVWAKGKNIAGYFYMSNETGFFFLTAPTFWSVSEYLLVLVFWIYWLRKSEAGSKYVIAYVGANIAIYFTWIAVGFIGDPVLVAIWLASVINLSMAVSFAILGRKVYEYIYTLTGKYKFKIMVVSVICFVSFLGRSIVFLVDAITYVMHNKYGDSITSVVVWHFYLLFLELIPEMVILFALGGSMRKKKREDRVPILQQEIDDATNLP